MVRCMVVVRGGELHGAAGSRAPKSDFHHYMTIFVTHVCLLPLKSEVVMPDTLTISFVWYMPGISIFLATEVALAAFQRFSR